MKEGKASKWVPLSREEANASAAASVRMGFMDEFQASIYADWLCGEDQHWLLPVRPVRTRESRYATMSPSELLAQFQNTFREQPVDPLPLNAGLDAYRASRDSE